MPSSSTSVPPEHAVDLIQNNFGLQKTFELLGDIRPGTYMPDNVKCYDDNEIERLAQTLNRLLYAPSQIRRKLQQLGVNVIPSSFYSEIPNIEDIERSFSQEWDSSYDCIFKHDKLVRVLGDLLPFSAEFTPALKSDRLGEFAWENGAFSYSDAMAYYSIIRHVQPKTIVEIGSGWSTLVADAAIKKNGGGRIICIEPFPLEFLRRISTVEFIAECPVQQVPASFFNELMTDEDILFIDSTHTVKHGSDCLHIYLKILPHLKNSAWIHAHDIYLPFTLPLDMLRDRQLYWTEQYLLFAYLLENRRAEAVYGSRYHFHRNNQQLTSFMHSQFQPGGASFWFTQGAA